MKKEVNQIVIFIGFIIYVVGLVLSALMSDIAFSVVSLSSVAVVLGLCFVFAKNEVVKKVGYGLCVVGGADGLYSLLGTYYGLGAQICYIGQVVMFVGVIIFFISMMARFFGYEKNKTATTGNFIQALNSLNSLKQENVITEEEFEQLKTETLQKANKNNLSIADIKQWKKLYDQKIITEEEFSNVKKDLFKN